MRREMNCAVGTRGESLSSREARAIDLPLSFAAVIANQTPTFRTR